MKCPAILIAFVLISNCSFAQTTPIDSFYLEGCTWTNAVSSSFDMQYRGYATRFTVLNDSVFNSYTYHLINSETLGSYYYTTNAPYDSTYHYTAYNNGIIGGVRVSGLQVYYYDFRGDSERILYDYNYRVGDTIPWKPYNNVVDSIDTIMLPNGRPARQFYFYNLGGISDYWLQGIGSNLSFLGSYYSQFPDTSYNWYKLICYSNPGYTLHIGEAGRVPVILADDCFDNLSELAAAGVPVISDIAVEYYPNPMNGDALFFSGTGIRNIQEITVTDLAGRAIYDLRQPFHNGNTSLDIQLATGTYIVKMIMENGSTQIGKITRI